MVEYNSIRASPVGTNKSLDEFVVTIHPTKQHNWMKPFVVVTDFAGFLRTLDGHTFTIQSTTNMMGGQLR